MEIFSEYGISFWTCAFIGWIFICYLYLTRTFNYWKKRGINGPKPHIFIGTFKPTWKYRVEDQDMENVEKYGRLYGGFEGSRPILFTCDPDIIKQITVKDFTSFPNRRVTSSLSGDKYVGKNLFLLRNDDWKAVRNTISLTFTTGKLKQMVGLIKECVNDLLISLESCVIDRKTIEFNDQFSILTLEVITSCAFGSKINCIRDPQNKIVVKARNLFRSSPLKAYLLMIFSDFVKYAKYLPFKILPNTFEYFIVYANKIIETRWQSKQMETEDFLELMLNAEIKSNNNYIELDDFKKDKSKQITQEKKIFTRDITVAQTILFLLAGHETTANTLCFMAYELAMNQNIQDKLITEIDETLSQNKGKLTYDLITSMHYLEMILCETLRLYPPVCRLERNCEKDGYKLNGITLKNGTLIYILVYALHHDPEFYPNPNMFDPDRFSVENKAKRNPFTYIPFGVGPRGCVAMRFALMEVKIAIIMLLSKFRFQTSNETIQLRLSNPLGLLQPDLVQLFLEKRTD